MEEFKKIKNLSLLSVKTDNEDIKKYFENEINNTIDKIEEDISNLFSGLVDYMISEFKFDKDFDEEDLEFLEKELNSTLEDTKNKVHKVFNPSYYTAETYKKYEIEFVKYMHLSYKNYIKKLYTTAKRYQEAIGDDWE